MLSSVTVIMRKPIHQFLLMLLLAFAVAGVFGQSTVQAAGEFEVPTINDHFNQVEKGPEPKKEKIVTQNPPKEEKGFRKKLVMVSQMLWTGSQILPLMFGIWGLM